MLVLTWYIVHEYKLIQLLCLLTFIMYHIFHILCMTCFLKSFHIKFYFSFYQTKGISHEKVMQKFLFFLFIIFFKISTQKSSCSYWLCECEAYPNCAWEIQIWIYSNCFTVCTSVACHLKEFWVLHEIVLSGLRKKRF